MRRIVLAEGEDARIQAAAIRIATEGFAAPILIGDQVRINEAMQQAGAAEGLVEIVDPKTSSFTRSYAEAYHALRKHKGVDLLAAEQAVLSPLVFAAMMVRQGDGDGTIAGAVHTTADTVRAAFQIIGMAEGVKTVSSFIIMLLDQPHHPEPDVLLFADCALTIQPSSEELAQIAISSADSMQALLGETPRVAMLSFSTAGSATHERVSVVSEAVRQARAARPDLAIDGELQFDAAFVPDVASRKAPESALGGRANVLVFPSLEAGNIGYKIAQRIGGAKAIGPILQGLAKPANDLSRGCNEDDVYALVAVTAMQANSMSQ